jgi:hypothetical protein
MRVIPVTVVLSLALGAGATAAASARTPVVPAAVQARIKARAPGLAYVPTRVALGFRYSGRGLVPGAVRIRFRNRAGWEIAFVAAPLRGDCRTGMEKSFQLDGNKVYWSHTANEQQAWRCVVGPSGRAVRLVAASPQPPSRLADVGLGIVAASGKYIGW